jgi:hypothetical protein
VAASFLGRLHAVQKGIKTDSKSKEGKTFLLQQMDNLEKVCVHGTKACALYYTIKLIAI